MRIAVMQPYIFPYIGYFQLINAVDKFVVYDNIKYTKKGWVKRNRLLYEGKVGYFTINLKNDSEFLNIVDRKISPVFFEKEVHKILWKIKQNYTNAPFYKS